jgi:hypothetical protein
VIESCANPECGKAMHYLREGRIFVFLIAEPERDARRAPTRIEHYWLCGHCCCFFTLRRAGQVVDLIARPSRFVSNANEERAV